MGTDDILRFYVFQLYWAAPALGGVLAGIVYEVVFAANTSLGRMLSWVKDSDYDPDSEYAVERANGGGKNKEDMAMA